MISARDVLERRLLAALEQSSEVALPPAWEALRPAPERLRPAAALLLRIQALRDRQTMARELRAMADRVHKNRDGREGGEADLWPRLAAALDALDEPGEEGGGLLGLKLWTAGASVPVEELRQTFRRLSSEEPEAGEPFLAGVARVLLRSLARRWTDETRKAEA